MNWSYCRLLALVALALDAGVCHPQEITILTEDQCASCTIEVTPDIVLGTDGESVIGYAVDIQRLSDGRFVMAFDDAPYEFTVFSADGSAYRRVGRRGQGPGEYGHVWTIREHGDRLHVFDRAGMRMTVLERDYEVVGTMPVVCFFCLAADMAVLPDGSTVLNFGVPEGASERDKTPQELMAAERWLTVHIMGEDGQPRLSMDMADRTEGGEPFRHLEIAPDGSLLSARSTEYRIDRWDPATGEHLESVLREADWWPEVNPAFSGGPDQPPPTRMEAMHVDEAGRLWLYINRPTRDWRDHVEIGLPVEGAFRYGPGATEWFVEVVDMEAGRVIVSQVVDVEPGAARFFAPGWLAVYNEDGFPQYRMHRVRLLELEQS
ncbi:MAG: hypothetical protein OXF01_13950 [Gemmatimonadetes bacterium]|nr:hypothetical protein [Gemmatimonadota bacterium]